MWDGIFSALGGLASSAMSMASGKRSQQRAMDYGREMTAMNMQYGDMQATKQRDWAGEQANTARDFNASQAQKFMDFTGNQAQTNRAFQERMARNKTQYAMEDMRRAGVNPILAVRGGIGAGVPSGAMGSGSAGSASAPGGATASAGSPAGVGSSAGDASGLQRAFSSAGQLFQQRKLIKSQVKLNQANASLTNERKKTEGAKQYQLRHSVTAKNLATKYANDVLGPFMNTAKKLTTSVIGPPLSNFGRNVGKNVGRKIGSFKNYLKKRKKNEED